MQAFFLNFLLAPAFEISQTPKWRCEVLLRSRPARARAGITRKPDGQNR
jgi:hypothetical protein